MEVDWQPFFLNHNTPAEGEDMYEHLAKKYGRSKAEQFTAPDNPLTRAGSKVGITFNPSRRIIRTEASHRLVEFCKEVAPDKEDMLMEEMFKAYFEQGKDLSKHEELLACATASGLDSSSVLEMLESERFRREVSTKARSWSQQGVSGVPFFVIYPKSGDGQPVAFSGAQPPEVIENVLREQIEE